MKIKSKKIYIDNNFVEASIEVEDGRIKSILSYDEKVDKDYGDMMIVPGFYDIHSHGVLGYFTNDNNEDGLRMWAKEVVKEGLCGFLPTTVTASKEEYFEIINTINIVKEDNDGAKILGLNMEGPYINPKYQGAHPKQLIREPNIAEFEEILKVSNGLVKIMTLAPEMDQNHLFIKHFKDQIKLSIGHSDATSTQAKQALNDGMKCFTHTFNSMSPFKHRENGNVGAALLSDGYAEIICDGQMISLDTLKIFFKMKEDHAIMVSDCLPGKNMKPGSVFVFGGKEVIIDECGLARVKETNNIAGSTLRFNDGLKRLVKEVGVPFAWAIKSCSENPMKYLGINDRGLIKKDNVADLVVLDDDYNVKETYVAGVAQINK